jgi:hypothetical protein
MGFPLPAALAGLCLAGIMGCGGRNLYSVPNITGFQPDSAQVGSQVVISGTGFKGLLAVSFGGQPATAYKLTGDTQITATLPPTAVTGPIAVQTPGGLGNSGSSFVVAPVLDSIAPDQGNADTTITLTGSGFYNPSSVTIGGVAAAQVTYLDPNHLAVKVGTAVPAGAGAVVVTASGLQASGPVFTVD